MTPRNSRLSHAAEQELKHIKELVAKAKRLAQLPDDFRDLMPGSKAWEDFYELCPTLREDMDLWKYGPVVALGDITEGEKRIIGSNREYTVAPLPDAEDPMERFVQLEAKIIYYDAEGYTLMYMPTFLHEVPEALNVLLRTFQYNIRCKALLTDDNGRRLKRG